MPTVTDRNPVTAADAARLFSVVQRSCLSLLAIAIGLRCNSSLLSAAVSMACALCAKGFFSHTRHAVARLAVLAAGSSHDCVAASEVQTCTTAAQQASRM